MAKVVKMTEGMLRKIVEESVRKTIREQITRSEIDYYLEHLLMDYVHDKGQEASSAINRYIIPSLKGEIASGILNDRNVDIAKLNNLLKELDKYADTIDNAYNKVYALASEVLMTWKA